MFRVPITCGAVNAIFDSSHRNWCYSGLFTFWPCVNEASFVLSKWFGKYSIIEQCRLIRRKTCSCHSVICRVIWQVLLKKSVWMCVEVWLNWNVKMAMAMRTPQIFQINRMISPLRTWHRLIFVMTAEHIIDHMNGKFATLFTWKNVGKRFAAMPICSKTK